MSNTTTETIRLIKESQQAPNEALAKAWSQSGTATSGITAYDLEPGAKLLFPVLSPLRNSTPRVSGAGGIQANWRAITAINSTGISAGVGSGNRAGVTSTTTADYNAAYKTLGFDDYATFEAELSARGFDDLRSITVKNLLSSLMIGEEHTILGGNGSLALGTTPTPTLAGSTSGGTLAAATWSVICIALTYDGYRNASVSAGCVGLVTRTNADASVDTYGGGSAQKSAAATVVTTGSTSSIGTSVTAVRGAVGYAWFWGAGGSETLGAITTINSYVITATATGTQLASAMPSSDQSRNTLVYDGLLTQIYTSGNNAYFNSLATGTVGTGTALTSDSAGGIVQIDAALKSMWDVSRLSPTVIYVNSQEMTNISAKILTASSTSAQRFVFNSDQGMLAGGVMVRSYLNRYAMGGMIEIPIKLHPSLPPGTILFVTEQLPYALSNVSNVLQVRTRQEYYQIEWPQRSRKYEYGVYVDEVLQNYFPPAFGVITNIANG